MPSKKTTNSKRDKIQNPTYSESEKLQLESLQRAQEKLLSAPGFRVDSRNPTLIKKSHLPTHKVPDQFLFVHLESKYILYKRMIDFELERNERQAYTCPKESEEIHHIYKFLASARQKFAAKTSFYTRKKILDVLLHGRSSEKSPLFKDYLPLDLFRISFEKPIQKYRDSKKKCLELGFKETELDSMNEEPSYEKFKKIFAKEENEQMIDLLTKISNFGFLNTHSTEDFLVEPAYEFLHPKFEGDVRKYLEKFFNDYVSIQ